MEFYYNFSNIFSNCAKEQVSDDAKNAEVSQWLWKVSEKWTGLDNEN